MESDDVMKKTTKDDIFNFNESEFCDEIEQKCPTLSAALKGSLGILVDDKEKTKPCRALVYGSIFKTR